MIWRLALIMAAAGCAQRPTLSPTADVYAQRAAELASSDLRLAASASSIAVALCGYSHSNFEELMASGLELPENLRSPLALGQPAISYNSELARYSLELEGELDGSVVVLAAAVTTPTRLIEMTLYQDNSGGPSLATVSFETQSCDQDQRLLSGSIVITTRDANSTFSYPSASSDRENCTFDAGALLPAEGAISWAGTTTEGRAALTTEEPSAISDSGWPSSAEGRNWEGTVDLDLDGLDLSIQELQAIEEDTDTGEEDTGTD